MKKLNKILFLLIIGLVVACKKDDVTPEEPQLTNEEELITTLKITLVDQDSIHPTVVAIFKDVDGPGGNAPSIFDTIRLAPNTTYLGTIEILNESSSPVINLTTEVLAEATDHLFCFSPSNLNLAIVRTDSDGTYEIGIQSKWTTGNNSSGNNIIRLKHQPGVKNGSCDLGETDIEVDFQTIIQ